MPDQHLKLKSSIAGAGGLPPDVKSFLLQLLERSGPPAVDVAVGFLEARFPLWAPALEVVKAEVLRLIPTS